MKMMLRYVHGEEDADEDYVVYVRKLFTSLSTVEGTACRLKPFDRRFTVCETL